MIVSTRLLDFPTPEAKARWMSDAADDDAALRLVISTAQRFAEILDPALRVEAMHRFARDCITYVRDLGGEELADAGVILSRGFDDCDGKSRVLKALAIAAERIAPAGVRVRMVPVYPEPGVFSHVTVEFWWPGSSAHPRARDGWVRSETILAHCPLGAGFEAAQRDDAGRILYA